MDATLAPRRPTSPSALRLIAAAIAMVTASGCTMLSRSDPEFYQSAYVDARPHTAPQRSISSFSDGLACMDQMLREQSVGTTLVTSKSIPDVSGKAAVAAKEMIITALSQMSRTSNAFRYVDFEVEIVKQDTVQNLTSLLLPSSQMEIRKPVIYVSGAISYLDSGVTNERYGFGITGEKWELGFSRDRVATLIGLELHLGDFVSRTLIPGIDSANEIAIGNSGAGGDGGGRIRKNGVQFNFGRDLSQGVGPAVRTLVELGMIEIIGRWARVPYWQCLSMDHTHAEHQRQLRDWFESMAPVERVRFFQNALRRTGHFVGPVDGRDSPSLRVALRGYQESANIIPTGFPNFEAYERLMREYVALDGDGKLVRIGWLAQEQRKPSVAEQFGIEAGPPIVTPDRVAVASERDPRELAVSMRVNAPEGKAKVGDALEFNIVTGRTAFLTCFYRDGQNRIARIYPNPLQTARRVQANRAVLVPDTTNPNTFSIEMSAPGRQSALCLASELDLLSRLPISMRGPALEPIASVRSLVDIVRAADQALGANNVGRHLIEWSVEKP